MTDNQNSGVTMDKQVPPTDRPLTAGDVPLLREGDVVAPISDLTDYRGGKLLAGVPVPVLNVSSDGYIRVTDPERGHLSYAFTFVSHPATSAPSEGEGADDAISLFETVCEYLLGEGPLRGQQFGDEPPTMKSGHLAHYWWRHDLRAARDQIIAALASPPVSEREREAIDRLKNGIWTGKKDSTTVNMCDLNDALAVIRRLTAQQEPV